MSLTCLVALCAILAGSPMTFRDVDGTLFDSETCSAIPCDNGILRGFSTPADPMPEIGAGAWTGSGPWGGNVRAIASLYGDDDILVVGCGYSMASDAGGVWRSIDGGLTWQPAGLQARQVNSVCSAGAGLPNSFYASTRSGLYLSQDQGQTWSTIPGMSTAYVLATGPHWTDPDILIAGLSSNQGIRRTADGGQTWTEVGLSSGYLKGYGFCVDHPDTMFIAMSGLGYSVYRSTNAGLSWSPVGPAGSGWGLLTSPAGEENVLIVTHDDGYYLSSDYGNSWDLVVTGTTYAPAVSYGASLFAPIINEGVYESSNGGVTWSLNTLGIVESYWQAGCASSAGYLAGHRGGIYRQQALGGTYLVSQEGISNGFIHAVSFLEQQGALFAAGEAHGLWKSMDGGLNWTMSAGGLTNWTIYDLWPESNDQYQGTTMYAATQSGAFRSDDAGASWDPAGLAGTQVTSVAFDPADPDRAWAGTATGGVRYSINGGITWLTGSGLPSALYPVIELAEAPGGGLRVLVSFQQLGSGVYYSDDGGVSYSMGTGLSGNYMPCISYLWGDSTAYCGTDGGVFRSFDTGETWEICPGSSGLLWAVLGSRNQNVFAGTGSAGVKWSPDGGGSWQPLDEGIENRCIWEIVYGASDTQLFAGLRGFGVLELSSDELRISSGETPAGLLSVSVSPSPATGSVSFFISGSVHGPVEIEVFDSTGRRVYTSTLEPGLPGYWDIAETMPSGVYHALARSGSQTATTRFVLLH